MSLWSVATPFLHNQIAVYFFPPQGPNKCSCKVLINNSHSAQADKLLEYLPTPNGPIVMHQTCPNLSLIGSLTRPRQQQALPSSSSKNSNRKSSKKALYWNMCSISRSFLYKRKSNNASKVTSIFHFSYILLDDIPNQNSRTHQNQHSTCIL